MTDKQRMTFDEMRAEWRKNARAALQNEGLGFDGEDISVEGLESLEPEIQREVMREWFHRHYEDPLERCPWDSEDKEYVFIFGGPYEASDVLQEYFTDIVPEEVILELAEDLSAECPEWSGVPGDDEYDEEFLEANTPSTRPYETMRSAIAEIRNLLASDVSAHCRATLLKLLFANAITTLEVYLSDLFTTTILNDHKLFRRFVGSWKPFGDEKVSINELFEKLDSIENAVRKQLLDVMWHNLPRVGHMYSSVLKVSFPDSSVMEGLYKAVKKRHDIVHRNGKTTDGEEVVVERATVEELLREIESLANHIDSQFPPRTES